jgi:hypothetical protein
MPAVPVPAAVGDDDPARALRAGGAFEKGVRWRWLSVNPVLFGSPPAARRPDPRPPTTEEAARIVEAAWEDWTEARWAG